MSGVRNELIILKNRSLVEKRAEGIKFKILFEVKIKTNTKQFYILYNLT